MRSACNRSPISPGRRAFATVATGDVLYHVPQRRILQDVLTCIREGCTIDDAGFRRERSADRHLKPPEEMARLFAHHPDAVARTQEIADRCRFSLDELRYQYPHEVRFAGLTAQQTLEQLTREGAQRRYPEGVPDNVTRQLHHELDLDCGTAIRAVFPHRGQHRAVRQVAGHICARAADPPPIPRCATCSASPAIDPTRSGLLFERFVSAERKEPPDIDVDFEHERREEVIQWVYNTYGRHRAAICATVIRYRGRGAIRDVGKAMGLPEDVTSALATQISHWGEEGMEDEHAAELNLNMEDRRLRLTLDLARTLIGFPRHLSQHPGRFRADRRPAGRTRPDRAGTHGKPPGHRMGQGRHRRAAFHEGGRAGPGHARLPAPRLRSADSSIAARRSIWPPSLRKTRTPTR